MTQIADSSSASMVEGDDRREGNGPSSEGHMPGSAAAWNVLFAAWLVALAASLGALFIGEVMGQTPCLLCWHQRAFMFPLAVILGIAVFREDAKVWVYAGPLALLGGLIAAYHTLLYFGVIAEALRPCGKGPSCSDAQMTIAAIPIPVLSLAAFAAIIGLLAIARTRRAQ